MAVLTRPAPSARAAKVTEVLIKCCQDMLTERSRHITN